MTLIHVTITMYTVSTIAVPMLSVDVLLASLKNAGMLPHDYHH